MPEATQELVLRSLGGTVLPSSYGDGDGLDCVLTLWSGIVFPYLNPTEGVVSLKGREVLTAIMAAAPSGLALHGAYDHSVDVWRNSEVGQEAIEALDSEENRDAFAKTDIRDMITGRFEDERMDPFLALYKVLNEQELEASRTLADFEDSDEEL